MTILAAAFLVGGCGTKPAEIPTATIPTGNAIAKASAYVDAADGAVVAAKPHANGTGRTLLEQAGNHHGSAREELAKADQANQRATAEASKLAVQNQRLAEDYLKLEGTTGVKVERFIRRALTWVCVYLGLMFALRIAALFVSGPVGAAMSVASTVMNPAAWFHSLADNVFFRRKQQSK